MPRVELQFMPRARKWRVLVDGKSLSRRFSDRASAVKEFEKQKANLTSKGVECPDCEGQGSTDLINPVYCLRCNHSGVIDPTLG